MTEHTQSNIPDGYLQDAQGNLVLKANIKPETLLESDLVENLVATAKSMSADLVKFKIDAFDEVGSFEDLVLEKYGAKKGGAKGNMTLRTFDHSAEVEIAVSETLSFGPSLKAAKALIDECVAGWAEGADDNVKTLVMHAFQVNKLGRIDTKRVLGLRSLKIKNPLWQKAMNAVSDAIRVDGSTTYMRFYEAHPKTGKMIPIVLSFAGAHLPDEEEQHAAKEVEHAHQ